MNGDALAWLRAVHAKHGNGSDLLVAATLENTNAKLPPEHYAITSDEIMELTGMKRANVADALRRLEFMGLVKFFPNPNHVGRGRSLVYARAFFPATGDTNGTKSTGAKSRTEKEA